MLGGHPQAYGFPELNLNATDKIQTWWKATGGSGSFAHGLLRAVAQLHHGVQDPETIDAARNWLGARLHWSTDMMSRELADQVNPRVIVEKSPLVVGSIQCLERLPRFFPDARFIHLTRHPRSTCKSVLKTDWVRRMFTGNINAYDLSTTPPTLDPQRLWHSVHTRIKHFVGRLPSSRGLTIQSEAFLIEPDQHLERVVRWLGLPSDSASIEEMKHPERSPFAVRSLQCYVRQ